MGGDMRKMLSTVLIVVAMSTAGNAQELTVAFSAYTPFGLDDLDGELPLSAELRVTVPISERFAIEPFVTAGRRIDMMGTEGFYGLQIRQRVVSFTNAYVFAAYGVSGYYSRTGYEGPIIGQFGIGLNQRMWKRLAFRPEVQVVTFHVVPIGARFVAGLSVNAGR
jgi:hypothetical protein